MSYYLSNAAANAASHACWPDNLSVELMTSLMFLFIHCTLLEILIHDKLLVKHNTDIQQQCPKGVTAIPLQAADCWAIVAAIYF